MTDEGSGSLPASSEFEERIPLPEWDSMTSEQRAIAERLVQGPRKGVVGPFVPLMRAPRLLNLLEPLGSELRFRGQLDERIRELVICAVARHTSNQFEWTVHVPLATRAGVHPSALAEVLEGRVPTDVAVDERVALEFAQSVMVTHDVSDALFDEAKSTFGDEGVVELVALIGYFVTVCWMMNVARTTSHGDPATGFVRPLV